MSVRLNGLCIAPGCWWLSFIFWCHCLHWVFRMSLDVRMTLLSRWHVWLYRRCGAHWAPCAQLPSVCASSQRWALHWAGPGQVAARLKYSSTARRGLLSPGPQVPPPPACVLMRLNREQRTGRVSHGGHHHQWSVGDTGKKCHTHPDYQTINTGIFLDSRHHITSGQVNEGKRWVYSVLLCSSFIFLHQHWTLFLCLLTWHEIMDRSRKGNIWFILFHATLK